MHDQSHRVYYSGLDSVDHADSERPSATNNREPSTTTASFLDLIWDVRDGFDTYLIQLGSISAQTRDRLTNTQRLGPETSLSPKNSY